MNIHAATNGAPPLRRPPGQDAGSLFAKLTQDWQRIERASPTTSDEFDADATFLAALRRSTLLGRISLPMPPLTRLALPITAPLATWVAEGAMKPIVSLNFDEAMLRGKKLICLGVMTAEAARAAGAATAFRNIFETSVNSALEKSVLDIEAADATRPAGLLNGITIGNATTPSGALNSVLTALSGKANPADISIIGSPRMLADAAGATLFAQGRPDFPQLVPTDALPAGRMVGVIRPMTVSTIDAARVSVSNQALVDIAGTKRSCWQENLVAVLTELWSDWIAAPGAVAACDVA